MLIAFLIYLINVFDMIQQLATLVLIFGICLVVLFILFRIACYFDDGEFWDKRISKRIVKYVSIFFIVLSLIVVFVPRSETMYLMVASYLASKVIENPEVNENLSKVYKIITYKLDEALDEYEQNLKENTSKALSR